MIQTRLLLFVVATATVYMATNVGSLRYPELTNPPDPEEIGPSVQHGPAPSESFPYQERLAEDYTLYWDFNDTHITFEVVVRTNGWVGFGISPKGAMKSSDVVIGWVKDGHVHFADRHADGNFLPERDSSQDWTLVKGQEVGQYTVLKMTRLLDTCDDEDDVVLQPGTTRVVYAYSSIDPSSDNTIGYHGTTRGTKSVFLLNPATGEKHQDSLPWDVKVLEFTNGNVSVPSSDTTYWCTLWKVPDLGGKHHMIRYEPIIQPGHERLLHHMLLYYCSGNVEESDLSPDAFSCYGEDAPYGSHRCLHVLAAWAIGGEVFNYPTHAGYSLGGAGDPGYFRMETHYDNPHMRSDYVDDSGIRLYLTQQLRTHDAGVLTAGVTVSGYQIIPPYEQRFLSQGFCKESCLAEGLGDQEIHVFANLLHAHLIGVKLRTRHFRNGTELPPIQEDNNYDFDYQETRYLNSERTIKKGDSLLVECEYDSTGRTSVTYGGLSSQQEMCLSFLLYYPRTQHSRCTSRLDYEHPDIFGEVVHADWNDPVVHGKFRKTVDDAQHRAVCFGSEKLFQSNLKAFPTPKHTEYHKPDVCLNK